MLQEPAVVRTRFVNVRFDLLGNRAQGPGKTLRLNLFDDTVFQADFERWDQVDFYDSIWVGKIDGVPFSNVTLVARDGLMQGQVSMPDGIYQIRYVGNGVHAIQQINQHALPPEAPPLRPHLPTPTIKSPTSDFKIYLPFIALGSGTSLTSIDVLVAYTPAARNAQGGTAAMEAHIALAVALTNTSYQNSGINQRLNLVRAMETNYTESGSMATDLYRVTGVTGYEGYMTDVRAARETYRADLVSLLTMPDPQYCGIAWLMTTVASSFAPWGYSVVAAGSCATSNYSFAHELGHNMGAR
ncbi:MAG: zinc-dependent metalloprotease, partial [Anaerolineae bacterium]|nr:zinc-dependent metalloprotease [Anaerolineae bacterium]